MKDIEDAMGHELMDCMKSGNVYYAVERDDGMIDSHPVSVYFSSFEHWADHQKEALSHAQGRVLDIGCGAGRHSLYLQENGLDVVGIDLSPLAIEVCRARGASQRRGFIDNAADSRHRPI